MTVSNRSCVPPAATSRQTTRRDVLIALPLLCTGSRVQAYAPKVGRARRIGLLGPDNPTYVAEFERPFLSALRKAGWTEGANLVVARAYADGADLAGRAEDLVRQRVDVVVCLAQASVVAARATRTVPIVFGDVLWPIEAGLIDSFARPGRNATGVASYTGIEITTKRLEYLRQIAREAKRLA